MSSTAVLLFVTLSLATVIWYLVSASCISVSQVLIAVELPESSAICKFHICRRIPEIFLSASASSVLRRDTRICIAEIHRNRSLMDITCPGTSCGICIEPVMSGLAVI